MNLGLKKKELVEEVGRVAVGILFFESFRLLDLLDKLFL